jgi:hypothetical protein
MRSRIAILLLVTWLGVGLSASVATAKYVNYLGKTSWTAKITECTDPAKMGVQFTITGAISKIGDEFYLFQGYVTAGQDGTFVLSGSGIMKGTTLEFSLTTTQEHAPASDSSQWLDSGVMHVSIDTSQTPWMGSFYEIGNDYHDYHNATPGQFDQRFTYGTLSGQPLNLNASMTIVPETMLLNQ